MSALERIIKRARLHRQAKSQRQVAKQTAIVKRSPFVIEALEQRILLSADFLPTALVPDLNSAAGPAAIVAPLDPVGIEAAPKRAIADTVDDTLTVAPQLLDDNTIKVNNAGNRPTIDGFTGDSSQTADPLLPPLVVTGFVPTQTGFTVKFNREIEASVISLYDVESGSIGAADATLTGAIGGQVKGSLIFYNDQLWFFARGGVLPPDTYTATLRTAVNAIKDTNGNLLDGNNDGIAGDNYSTTFTVNPSSGVIVSIPDFARAPGQGVSIPASDGGIPVTISNGAGVTSVNLTLNYNPALFDIIGVKPGNSMPADTRVQAFYFSGFGQVQIVLTSPVPLAAGTVEILRLTARVPENVVYGTASLLFVSSATFNTGSAARLDPALIVTADFGDTTGNGAYSSLDAQRALRVAAGLDSGFAAFPGIDPVIIGDVSGNGQISSLDATRILQFVAGIPTPQIPRVVEWINPGSGFWDDPSNWSGGVVPGVNDDVLIERHEDITITFRTGTSIINRLISRASLAMTGGVLQVNDTMQVDGELIIGNGATLRNATLLPSGGGHEAHVISSANFDDVIVKGKITVDDLGSVHVQNGLTLDGRLTLASAGNSTSVIFKGDQTLAGSGEIVFAGVGQQSDNRLDSDGTLTIDTGILVRGTANGTIGDASADGRIILRGNISADSPDTTIFISSEDTQIAGKLRVLNGATISLGGTFSFPGGLTVVRGSDSGRIVITGTLDNTGRTLALDSFTGPLIFDNGTIKGGRVRTGGGGEIIALSTVTLDGVTLAGDYLVFPGSETLVRGGLTLDSAQIVFVDFGTTSVPAGLRFLNDATLGGFGTVAFTGTADSSILSGTAGSNLTIGSNIQIFGRGTIGDFGNLVNEGEIFAIGSEGIINFRAANVTNQGLLFADGGDVFLSGNFINRGVIDIRANGSEISLGGDEMLQTDGVTFIAGGTLQATTVSLQGGVLSGFGTVSGALVNNAGIVVGGNNTAGTLQVTGAYTQTNAGVLNIEIGGSTAATQFDRLQITGAASLDGLLDVSLINNFSPSLGQSFAVVTYGSHGTTTFAGIDGLNIGGGLSFNPTYNATNLTLTVGPSLAPLLDSSTVQQFKRSTSDTPGDSLDGLRLDIEKSAELSKQTGKEWLFYTT